MSFIGCIKKTLPKGSKLIRLESLYYQIVDRRKGYEILIHIQPAITNKKGVVEVSAGITYSKEYEEAIVLFDRWCEDLKEALIQDYQSAEKYKIRNLIGSKDKVSIIIVYKKKREREKYHNQSWFQYCIITLMAVCVYNAFHYTQEIEWLRYPFAGILIIAVGVWIKHGKKLRQYEKIDNIKKIMMK